MIIDSEFILNKFNCEINMWLIRYVKFIFKFNITDSKSSKKVHKHHILPRSLYPEFKSLHKNKWNKCVLTHRAHLIAHYMLAKALGGNMWFAYNNMNAHGVRLKSRLYESAMINTPQVLSEYALKYLEINGHNRGMLGKKHSEETKKVISNSSLGRKITDEQKNHLRDLYNNKTIEEKNEINLKISLSKIGKKHSKETKAKMSKNRKGIENKYKGKSFKEIYGEEKAVEMISKMKTVKSKFKGMTYEEIYGKEKAAELKEKRRNSAKNQHKIKVTLILT